MAQAQVRNWNDASGSHTELLRPDGSWTQWTNGAVVGQAGADPGRAEAFAAGQYDAVAESTRQGNEWLASPLGQRYVAQEQKLGETTKLRGDQQYGIQKGTLDLNRDKYGLDRENTQFDNRLARDRFGLDERSQAAKEAELDRRFGLDSAKFGVDFFQTAAEYGKNPRSWLDSLQFENPKFMQQATMGLQNPAFGARGAVNPGMKNITDTLAASGGGGLNAGLVDPAKNIQQILKGAPPSESSGMTPKDLAAVQLIARMYEEGAQKMGEGSLESWDPQELQFAQGVMDNISPGGGDRYMRQYQKSRLPGRSNPFAAV